MRVLQIHASAIRIIAARPHHLLMLASFVGGICQAQTLPDAGSLLQRIERDRNTLVVPGSQPPTSVAPPLESMGAATVTVTMFRVVGNTLLSAERLSAATVHFLNRPLSFKQLQDAAAAVAEAYRLAGWIVNVYLPQQEIDGGVITLQVIEAVFGVARIEGAQPLRVTPSRIVNMVSAAQPMGQALNGDVIDRALLLLNDLPGIDVSGSLQAGQLAHQTDLALAVTDKPLTTGDVSLDNTGSRATGSSRLIANLNFNSPLRQGDLWGATALQAQGVQYLRLSHNMPLGYDGWRAGINASDLRYQVIASEFAVLDIKGSSSTFGVEASYPVIRSRLKNLYLTLNAEHKDFDNSAGGATSTRYRINTVSAGLAANVFDSIGGGGSTNANLSFVRGKLDLNGSPNQLADELSTQAAGNFSKLRYALGRQQVLTKDLSASVLVSGQTASKNLDSAEKFYLGGASGVRAYPSNEAGGSSGQMVSMELRMRLPSNLTLTGFYDWGQVSVNANNSFSGAAALNRYALQGAGLSLGWITPFGANLKLTWAHRAGSNPNPAANGNDQDGSLTRNRVWLVASQNF